MPFTTGTVSVAHGATGFLQNVLIPWLTGAPGTPGRDWTIEVNQNAKDQNQADTSHGATCKEYVLSNSGYSGSENVYIGFREHRRVAAALYGLELNVYTYDPTWFADNRLLTGFSSYDGTNEGWTGMPVLQMIDSTMTYYIYANPQRVVVVLKHSSGFFWAYVGFGRRLGSPNEYPFPLMCAGSAAFPTPASSGGYGVTKHADPQTNIMIVDPGNSYLVQGSAAAEVIRVYPMGDPTDNTDTTPYGPTPDGRYLLIPAYVCERDEAWDFNYPKQVYFVLDKVFVSIIQNQQSEDIYNDGRYDYRVFEGGTQGTDVRNFAAVREFISTTTSTSTTTTV